MGTEKQFFERGKKIAKHADQGIEIPEESVLCFEEPGDLLKLLTPGKIRLFEVVKNQPGPINEIADRLKRSQRSVTRDVSAMEKLGLLNVQIEKSPKRGRIKRVSVVASQLKLVTYL